MSGESVSWYARLGRMSAQVSTHPIEWSHAQANRSHARLTRCPS